MPPAKMLQYNAVELYDQLQATMKHMYPSFSSFATIFNGEPGAGKSTLIAAVPHPKDTMRLVLDMEDSMGFLDGTPEGQDIYTPNRQTFQMRRIKFPDLPTVAKAYRAIIYPEEDKNQKYKYGSLGIDNIAVFQDVILRWLINNADSPALVKQMWEKFDLIKVLPVDSSIKKWANYQDPGIWNPIKSIGSALVLACRKKEIYFVATTESTNVWENYNQAGAKIVGRKAKIWDSWYRYTDMVMTLTRDVNSRNAPMAELSRFQPKMRLQNMNPKFKMDWPNLIHEIEESEKRTDIEIPEEFRIKDLGLTEADSAPEEGKPAEPKLEE